MRQIKYAFFLLCKTIFYIRPHFKPKAMSNDKNTVNPLDRDDYIIEPLNRERMEAERRAEQAAAEQDAIAEAEAAAIAAEETATKKKK